MLVLFLSLLLLLSSPALPLSVYAQDLNLENIDAGYANLAKSTPTGFVQAMINIILVLAVITSFVLLLWGGFNWISSGGDKESLSRAKGTITWSLIGILATLSVYALMYLMESFFGVKLLNLTLPGF